MVDYLRDDPDLDWIDHSRGWGLPPEHPLVARRGAVVVLGKVQDPEASWDYDDWAVLYLPDEAPGTGETFYVVHTEGCSCPSPIETITIAFETREVLAMSEWMHRVPDYWVSPARIVEWGKLIRAYQDSVWPARHERPMAPIG